MQELLLPYVQDCKKETCDKMKIQIMGGTELVTNFDLCLSFIEIYSCESAVIEWKGRGIIVHSSGTTLLKYPHSLTDWALRRLKSKSFNLIFFSRD